MLKLDYSALICILLVFPLFTLSILRSAVNHIHALGKSRSCIKKERSEIPLWKKMLYIEFAKACRYHQKTAKRLILAYRGYIGSEFTCLAVLIFSENWPAAANMLTTLVMCKLFSFDIPVFLCCLLKTKHHKNGGVTWIWDKY